MEEISSLKLASVAARILDDNKALDIVILNVSNVSVLSDYFVIAGANSTPQVKGLTNNVRGKIKDILSRTPRGDETDAKNTWNIMHKDQRENYKIEKFWNHALMVDRSVWEKESKEYAIYEK